MSDNIQIHGPIILNSCAMAMDGGSKILSGVDGNGNALEIQLPQHIRRNPNDHLIPGRLHVNSIPIAVRSKQEADIVALLSAAKIHVPDHDREEQKNSIDRLVIGKDIQDFFSAIDKGPGFAVAHLLKEVIDFINSDEYLVVAKKFSS